MNEIKKIETIENKPLYDNPEYLQSGSNFPVKERIESNYNTYDNILKLVNIIDKEINVPALTFNPDGTASYSVELPPTMLSLQQTPFVDVEWRDPSNVSSSEANIFNITVSFNQTFLKVSFLQTISRYGASWGTPPVFPPTSAQTYKIRLFIFELNTKRRLDRYIK